MKEIDPQPVEGSPGCFICDNNGTNPRSLRLKLYWDEQNQTLLAPCEPDRTWCGYSSVVHGGLVASVLDEAMAWAVKMKTGDWAFTADCNIRFKKTVQPGRKYVVKAKVLEETSRKITTQAEFLEEDETGAGKPKLLARASAVFLPAKGKAAPNRA